MGIRSLIAGIFLRTLFICLYIFLLAVNLYAQDEKGNTETNSGENKNLLQFQPIDIEDRFQVIYEPGKKRNFLFFSVKDYNSIIGYKIYKIDVKAAQRTLMVKPFLPKVPTIELLKQRNMLSHPKLIALLGKDINQKKLTLFFDRKNFILIKATLDPDLWQIFPNFILDNNIEKEDSFSYELEILYKDKRPAQKLNSERLKISEVFRYIAHISRAERSEKKVTLYTRFLDAYNPQYLIRKLPKSIIGIRFYRSANPQGPFQLLNSIPFIPDFKSNEKLSAYEDFQIQNQETVYYYQARAVSIGFTEGPPTKTVPVAGFVPFFKPEILEIKKTNGQLVLNWQHQNKTNLTGYQVWRKLENANDFIKLTSKDLSSESFNFTDRLGADSVGKIQYKIHALYRSGEILESEIKVIELEEILLDKVKISQTKKVGGGVFLQWEKLAADKYPSYGVYRSENKNGAYLRIAKINNPFNFFTDKSVSPARFYWYKITGISKKGRETPFSDEIEIFVEKPPETKPPENLIGEMANQKIYLSWTFNYSPVTKGFRVYRAERPIGTDDKLIYKQVDKKNLSPTQLQFVDDEIVEGKDFFYYIVSFDHENKASSPSNILNFRIPGSSLLPPNEILILKFRNETQHGLNLRWKNPASKQLGGFNIYRRFYSNKEFEKINSKPVQQANYKDFFKTEIRYVEYCVTSVDNAGTESDRSKVIRYEAK